MLFLVCMNINLYMQDLDEWSEQAVALNNCVFTCSHLTRVFDLDRSQVTNFQPDFVTEGEMVFDLGLISCDKVDRCDWCSINEICRCSGISSSLHFSFLIERWQWGTHRDVCNSKSTWYPTPFMCWWLWFCEVRTCEILIKTKNISIQNISWSYPWIVILYSRVMCFAVPPVLPSAPRIYDHKLNQVQSFGPPFPALVCTTRSLLSSTPGSLGLFYALLLLLLLLLLLRTAPHQISLLYACLLISW